ncbi:type I polyketide synthase [Paenibacillus sp. BR2-3]|uniref:beta-ketoacyl synthase N-terminal-like domain-containing protein n=1 Tax=Paenibacillus sp. BR2-3 TaxID=3048494 RepID=UPI0039775773
MTSKPQAPSLLPSAGQTGNDEIAIIGISGKFSGSHNVEQYWDRLVQEQSSLQEAPMDRTALTRLTPSQSEHIRFGGFLPGIDQFDPLFFHISPKEAEHMDPRQRLFLEESWKAIEDAGYSLKDISGTKCGVFVGIQQGEYLERFQGEANEHVPTGNSLSVIPARISYLLNLKGPSVALDTACSSSLVALALACDSLNNGSSEMAIAGGVQIMLTPWIYMSLGKLGMLNKDGMCKPFDDQADGIGLGEGVGAVLLKKYSEAKRDGDHIYGVIKGIGVNQDGKTNGITAPNGLSQASLEREVYEKNRIHPEHITYVEAHGTGTRLGDPIEVSALTEAFGTFTNKKQYCHLGSVKGNIGHTLSASGMASLIKVLLSMKHGKIPATIHCTEENQLIDFKNSPFYVGTRTENWRTEAGYPRMAAVSSFGMSGTNCHLVVSEHPGKEYAEASVPDEEANQGVHQKVHLFALSAKSDAALESKARDLLDFLQKNQTTNRLPDISYTLLVGRDHYPFRSMFIAGNRKELERELEAFIHKQPSAGWFRSGGSAGNDRINPVLKEKMEQLISQFLQDRLSPQEQEKAAKLIANYYTKGYEADFKNMFASGTYKRISLPAYPFDYIRCWIDETEGKGTTATIQPGGLLHPLVHSNVSTVQGISFESNPDCCKQAFWQKAFFHTKVISEAILLEMAAKAAELGSNSAVRSLEHVQFAHPVAEFKQAGKLKIQLHGDGERIGFAILQEDEQKTIHVSGTAKTGLIASVEETPVDIRLFKRKAALYRTADELYQSLENQGIAYEEQAKLITNYFGSLQGVLAVIRQPDCSSDQYTISPQLTEAILQGLNTDIIGNGGIASVVYEISEVQIAGHMEAAQYIYFKSIGLGVSDYHYDVYVMTESGSVVLALKGVHMVPVSTRQLASAEQYSLLKKEWVKSGHTPVPSRPEGQYLIIVNDETDDDALAVIKESFDNALILCDGTVKTDRDSVLAVSFKEVEGSKQVIDDILGMNLDIKGLIDFSDIHDQPVHMSKRSYGKIMLLQSLVKKYAKGLRILHLTSGVQGPLDRTETLAGADMAGFIRTLSSEYKQVLAQTVDMDLGSRDINQLIKCVYAELNGNDGMAEICYADGIRYEPAIAVLKLQNKWVGRQADNRIQPDPQKVYVVTGGTRGIGAEAVRLLVRRGAKKLLLMGFQSYPPKEAWSDILSDGSGDPGTQARLKRVRELEDCGAEVEIYSGSLTHSEQLHTFLQRIRQQWGEIGGVIHCAGSSLNNHPAFINKRIDDIRHVFEPKVEGVEALHQLFEHDSLDFFILFSSISALSPMLSVGLSDYSAANYYMDLYARHQFTLGNKYFQSMIWPSWSEVGMLADSGFQLSPLYAQSGLTPHSLADGLYMLEDVICGMEYPSVVPAIIRTDDFNPDLLIRTSSTNPAKGHSLSLPGGHKKNAASTMPGAVMKEKIELIKDIFCEQLKLPKNRLRDDMPFAEIGVDSILLIEVIKKLDEVLHTRIDPALFFELRDVRALAEHLFKDNDNVHTKDFAELRSEMANEIRLDERYSRVLRDQVNRVSETEEQDNRIAVIGIGCHFPGARDKESFWNNLRQGVDSISEVPTSRWDTDELYSPVHAEGKSISKWGGFIEDIELFDAEYFEIRENAEQVSPLMRQSLEVTANVILDAGYEKSELSGRKVGVFIGAHPGSYPGWIKDINKNTIIGIGQNFIASYASHFFNFKGPSLTVDSACSSSLMSLHLACQSIRSGESEMAIAGGVDLILDERPYLVFSASKAMSPDGKCHTFDTDANGIVPGEGCGAVLLKPLAKAIADGDRIYSVIEASASNNDGRTMGVTTPSMQAQEEVIAETIRRANIDPRTIGYVETHGTGTMIGDPIELKALTSVYKKYTDATQFCGVGSVKTNIGHCLSAAGIASFIKAALSVYHKTLVPTLNCSKPNPRFDFGHSPFYPVMQAKDWERYGDARRAAVSSFGFGGTNVHMILGECEDKLLNSYTERRKPLPLAAFRKQRAWANDERLAQLLFLEFVEEM